jgi:hypothetical protein
MAFSSDFIKYAVSIQIDEPKPNRGKRYIGEGEVSFHLFEAHNSSKLFYC